MLNIARAARRPRTALVAGIVCLVAMFLFSAPAGLVWSVLAPRPELVLTADGAGYASVEPSAVIAADGWFAVVTAVAGLICGMVAYLCTGRRHSEVMLVSLTVGGLLAALVMWYVGRTVDITEFQRQVSTQPTGTHIEGFLNLHATGLLVVWPLLAVLTYMLAQIVEGVSGGRRQESGVGAGGALVGTGVGTGGGR